MLVSSVKESSTIKTWVLEQSRIPGSCDYLKYWCCREKKKLEKYSKRKEKSLLSELNTSLQPTKSFALRHEGTVSENDTDSMQQDSNDESVLPIKLFWQNI